MVGFTRLTPFSVGTELTIPLLSLEHLHFRRLFSAVRRGQVETSKRGNKQRSGRAWSRWDFGDWLIFVRAELGKHADEAFAARHVDPFVPRVIKDVVRISGAFQLRNCFARVCVEYEDARGAPAAYKQTVIGFIKRHRIIRGGLCDGPLGDDRALLPVNHRDLFRLRYVDEDARPRLLQREGLRVRGQLDIADDLSGQSLKNPDSSVAVTHIKQLGAGVVTQVVGVA